TADAEIQGAERVAAGDHLGSVGCSGVASAQADQGELLLDAEGETVPPGVAEAAVGEPAVVVRREMGAGERAPRDAKAGEGGRHGVLVESFRGVEGLE